MSTEQKKWERDMTALGVARFRARDRKAKEAERFTETSAGSRLLRVYLSQVSAEIAEQLSSRKRRNMYLKLLKGVDYDKLAMFTLYRIIECIYKPGSLQRVAANIGKMVEDELRFSKFELEVPEYYNAVQRDLDSRSSTQYRHRHRVLVQSMGLKNVEWVSWTNETHIGVGLVLISIAEQSSDLIQKTRRNGLVVVEPTEEVLDWITNHESSIEIMLPDRMPCIEPPLDWTDWKTGGFHTNRLNKLTPLVKTRSGQQRDYQSELLDQADMPVVLNSVNAMQRTSWSINKRILTVVREVWDRGLGVGMPPSKPYEIPPAPIPDNTKPKDLVGLEKLRFEEWKAEARTLHGLETERKSNLLAVVRAMRMASKMQEIDLLWLVYQLDFRGRTYATTSGVSPQGPDVSKALLHFGKALPLGDRGWFWFQVHGANKYGYDKGTYEERVSWVNDRRDALIAAGRDPIAHTDVWGKAEKPYQFLAWCMEYADAISTRGGPSNFNSRLPIALDGSCNGIQHFSAMLRDPVGGASVNLVPADRPSDIYQDVADVATAKLNKIVTDPSHEHYALAVNWKHLFDKVSEGRMSRKLAKKPVMTLPYGSTRQTCTQSVYSWYLELKMEVFPKNTAFRHSIFLSGILWDSIGEVVIAARGAMNWLQKVARILAKEDYPLVYVSPVGFPLVQFTPKMENKRIKSQIGGTVQLQIKKELPGINSNKAALGSSPNFVHDADMAHLHMTVDEGVRQGITHFAMIHDDFGTHACNIDKLHKIIRDTFVELHSGVSLLEDLKSQLEARFDLVLPDLPEPGDLDLERVRKSLFFFG